jgi:hypothetical protein
MGFRGRGFKSRRPNFVTSRLEHHLDVRAVFYFQAAVPFPRPPSDCGARFMRSAAASASCYATFARWTTFTRPFVLLNASFRSGRWETRSVKCEPRSSRRASSATRVHSSALALAILARRSSTRESNSRPIRVSRRYDVDFRCLEGWNAFPDDRVRVLRSRAGGRARLAPGA